jgi:ubiquinone/menaquinone biosynthesis C-methylase UbiE
MSYPLEHQHIVMHFIPNVKGKVVLDVGCGKGIYGYLIRALRGGDRAYMVGIDINLRFLSFVKKFRVYDDVILCDIRKLPSGTIASI